MGASPSRKRIVLDQQFGSGTPTNWYIGLALILPGADGTGWTEVPFTAGYARVLVANTVGNWPAATSLAEVASKKNANKITFPNPSGSWGNIVGWLAFLASTGGAPEFWAQDDTIIGPKNGNTPVEFDVNQLIATL